MTEGRIESTEGLNRQVSHPPESVVEREPLLDLDVGDQGTAALLLTSHQAWGSCLIFVELAGFYRKTNGPLLVWPFRMRRSSAMEWPLRGNHEKVMTILMPGRDETCQSGARGLQ